MSSRVDPAVCVVEVDGQRWPFEIELATGAAQLHLGTGTATVQPLTWREKITLARYADAGSELLDRALLGHRLSGHDPPDAYAGHERRAMVELARWMNGFEPYEGRAAPLDPARLGEVARRALGAGGLTLADLDALPAFEVELLAAASRSPELGDQGQPSESTSVPTPGGDQVTRIVVVPDPEPAPASVPPTPDRTAPTRPQPPGERRTGLGLVSAGATASDDLPFLAEPESGPDQAEPSLVAPARSAPLPPAGEGTTVAGSSAAPAPLTGHEPMRHGPTRPAAGEQIGDHRERPAPPGPRIEDFIPSHPRALDPDVPAPARSAGTPSQAYVGSQARSAAWPPDARPVTPLATRPLAAPARPVTLRLLAAPPAGPMPATNGTPSSTLPGSSTAHLGEPIPAGGWPEHSALGLPPQVRQHPEMRPDPEGQRGRLAGLSGSAVDALLIELARRLEQATSDLGLDPED